MNQIHIPVLADAVLQTLSPKEGENYLDLTAGYGGHAGLVLEQLSTTGRAVLVDRDKNAISFLEARFDGDNRVQLLQADFRTAAEQLRDAHERFDVILADIGVSSPHLDNPDRGFSFMYEGPLDMRMDQNQSLTAAEIINSWSKEDLATIFKRYGEVRGAQNLVEQIVAKRPLHTTRGLSEIIKSSIPGPRGTRVCAQIFQALRIAVNDELVLLESSLPLWIDLLKPGGRLGVITFHSLEDRIVKQYFAEHAGDRFDSDLVHVTKKPVGPTAEELVFNPRARSAKLRVVQRK